MQIIFTQFIFFISNFQAEAYLLDSLMFETNTSVTTTPLRLQKMLIKKVRV